MGLPEDAFVVGMNAANKGVTPNRKAFGENLLAFSIFAKDKKDVFLYLHTEPKGSLGGINLFELLQAVGIDKEKVRFADTYALRSGMSSEAMAALYTSMDVLLATSYGEGFGIPTIEAQATGTKVIVSNFAASAELCGDGWLIEGQPLWDAMQGSFFYVPSIPQITSALKEAYDQGRTRSQKAIDFAAGYDADLIYETAWKPALKVIKQHAIEHQARRLTAS
jgi:glycosyltransferase involved in cell wall biosynthesis